MGLEHGLRQVAEVLIELVSIPHSGLRTEREGKGPVKIVDNESPSHTVGLELNPC